MPELHGVPTAAATDDAIAGVLQKWLLDHGYALPSTAVAGSVQVVVLLRQLLDAPHEHLHGRSTPRTAWIRALTAAIEVVERVEGEAVARARR